MSKTLINPLNRIDALDELMSNYCWEINIKKLKHHISENNTLIS